MMWYGSGRIKLQMTLAQAPNVMITLWDHESGAERSDGARFSRDITECSHIAQFRV